MVAHTDHLVPRKDGFLIGIDELGILVADLHRSFANDDQIHRHRLMHHAAEPMCF
jgi:hypothetical protein